MRDSFYFKPESSGAPPGGHKTGSSFLFSDFKIKLLNIILISKSFLYLTFLNKSFKTTYSGSRPSRVGEKTSRLFRPTLLNFSRGGGGSVPCPAPCWTWASTPAPAAGQRAALTGNLIYYLLLLNLQVIWKMLLRVVVVCWRSKCFFKLCFKSKRKVKLFDWRILFFLTFFLTVLYSCSCCAGLCVSATWHHPPALVTCCCGAGPVLEAESARLLGSLELILFVLEILVGPSLLDWGGQRQRQILCAVFKTQTL